MYSGCITVWQVAPPKAHRKAVAVIAAQHGVEAAVIGVTVENGLEIRQRGNTLGAWEIAALRPAYENALMA